MIGNLNEKKPYQILLVLNFVSAVETQLDTDQIPVYWKL